MLIAILEIRPEKVGGRQDDACAFAELFMGSGHRVRMHYSGHRTASAPELHPRYRHLPLAERNLDFTGADIVIAMVPTLCPLVPPDLMTIAWTIAPDRYAPDTFPRARNVTFWANSEWAAHKLYDRLSVPPTRVTVVPSLRSYWEFAALGQADERSIDVLWVGYDGHFHDGTDKGYGVFSRIMARRPDWRGLAISTTPIRNMVESVEHRFNIRRSEVGKLMGKSKVLAMPSTIESAPIAIVEAIAAGVWPVAYDSGAIRELCGGFGDVIPHDADIMERMIEGALGQRLGYEARRAMAQHAKTRDLVHHSGRVLHLVERLACW